MNTIKNFYSLSDVGLSLDIPNALKDDALQCYNNYLHNLPLSEKNKLILFRKYITMMTLMIMSSKFPIYGTNGGDDSDTLFNLFFNTPQEQTYDTHVINLFELLKLKQTYDLSDQACYFGNILNLIQYYIGDRVHGAHYMTFRDGCRVCPHTHSEGVLTMHILLNDINGGKLSVTVNEETIELSKKGEYFIFEPTQTHSAVFSGDESVCLMITILKD
jgi:quercetin dioxygenase-like cupin family protein